MSVDLYCADQVTVIFGVVKIDGYAPDSFVKVERNEDAFSLKIGADGEPVRTRSLNKSGKVTLTLLQTSKTNPLLQALELADELSNNGVSVLPVMVKDSGGNALWVAAEGWITKPAATEAARESGTREWVIECAKLLPPIPSLGL